MAELVGSLGLPRDVAQAVLARVEISSAQGSERLSASVLEHIAAFAPRPSHRIAGGNQGLALAMAAQLGDRVRLRTPVRALDGEQVLTDGGALAARHVIVTLPLALARTLPITPALPDRQRAALDRAELGHAAKLHVALASAAATSAVMSVPDRYWCWTATGHDGAVAPVLNCFAGSPRALDGLRLDDGPAAGWPASPRSARTSSLAAPTVLTTWDDDPWARGAYRADGLRRRAGRRRPARRRGRHAALRRRAHGRSLERPDGGSAAQRAAGRRRSR